MAAEQQDMTADRGVAESGGSNTTPSSGGGSMANAGTGRRAEDISAAQQDYTADKESAHSSQSRSHHGSNTGLEQQDPHTAAAEAGGLLSKEDIQRLDREIGMSSDNSGGGSASAREPVSSSGAPQFVGSPGTGFGSSIGTSSSGDGRALETSGSPFTSGALSGNESLTAIPGSGPDTSQAGNLQGHHTTRMGEMLDPHLKR
ncbi:hypothetical protein KC345_g4146 [Hortaea werneckii]|nr:hypothetical protein KC345_g4146 [Hortaea werneckii]